MNEALRKEIIAQKKIYNELGSAINSLKKIKDSMPKLEISLDEQDDINTLIENGDFVLKEYDSDDDEQVTEVFFDNGIYIIQYDTYFNGREIVSSGGELFKNGKITDVKVDIDCFS